MNVVPGIASALRLDAALALSGASTWLTSYAEFTTAQDVAAGKAATLQQQAKPSEAAARAFVKLLKATPGITPQMLSDLRCDTPDVDTASRADAQRPILTLTVEGGQVVIKFVKHGHQGVLIYCRRAGETEWTLLGLDTHSPYIDTRPNLVAGQAEDRHYRAYYCDRDAAVGDLSDVATIAVRG